MAINPICEGCKKELNDFGAILFSPPNGNDVKKYHLCNECYKKIKEDLDAGTLRNQQEVVNGD